MRVGIVGFSQSGKSTLFEALTGVSADPSATMKGQVGIAKVQDERLDFLDEFYKPKKKTPAIVEFVDTPGLIRTEKADNPQRIATLRNADGLLVVIDGFSGSEDPASQLRAFREELFFADLEVVTNRTRKIEAGLKRPKPPQERQQDELELGELRKFTFELEAGKSISDMEFSEEMAKKLRSFQLFLLKPELVVLNQSEDRLQEPLSKTFIALNPNVVTVAAKLELDLGALEGEEREMFMQEMGVAELARSRIIRKAYDVVGLISFFTVGDDECKAWTIRQGTPALEAAGKIHTDIARGFIRAELCNYQDLHELGSMKEVKSKGLQRLEGKEYLVADGDIINFRFNV